MTIDRGGGGVRWWLYRDTTCSETACVSSGDLSVDMLQRPRRLTTPSSPDNVSNSSCFLLAPSGFQLAPEIQRRVRDLLEENQATTTNRKAFVTDASDVAFPVAVEDLSLGSRAKELGLDDKGLVYCKLQLVVKGPGTTAETMSSTQDDGDWFSWKLARAAAYRERGNEAFKQKSYSSAARLYKRALAWLEPPVTRSSASLDTKVQYSKEELQQVNPLAVACYTNMATCYSKLDADRDVDRCIAAASSALVLDDAHVKARYRRSQAYVSSKEFDLALADLIKLRELEPDNKLFRSALIKAQTAKTTLRKQQQNAYANLLGN